MGISSEDIFNFNFYTYGKPFTGSFQGMRYRIIKEEDKFLAVVWPEPLSFDATPEENRESEYFEFTEEGKLLVVDWLNEKLKKFTKAL